jgi:hypothetical protein
VDETKNNEPRSRIIPAKKSFVFIQGFSGTWRMVREMVEQGQAVETCEGHTEPLDSKQNAGNFFAM